MKLFSLVLFFHILAAIVWLGAGVSLDLLRQNASKTKDKNKIKLAINNNAKLSQQLFAPAGLTALITGILMVIISKKLFFSDTWILIALVGILIAIIHGALVVSKQAKDFSEIDVKSKDFNVAYKKFVFSSKISMAIITIVLLDMVVKPKSNYLSYALYSILIFAIYLFTAKKHSTLQK